MLGGYKPSNTSPLSTPMCH